MIFDEDKIWNWDENYKEVILANIDWGNDDLYILHGESDGDNV